MLFKQAVLEKVAQGQVTCAFRRWKRPTVKPGGTLRTPRGVLAITHVDVIDAESIRQSDARKAGFESVDELLRDLGSRESSQIYRIRFQLSGADPRIELRTRKRMSKLETEQLATKLKGMDDRSRSGPWTQQTLRLIAANPEMRAGDLSAKMNLETPVFKRRVRKLKELGLTESMGVGYRISPRGEVFLKQMV